MKKKFVSLVFTFSLFIFGIITTLSAQKSLLRTIVIDPGHGGSDGGARGAISREAISALKISLKLRDMLKTEIPDLKVLMTRESDVLPGGTTNINAALKWRADFANKNNGDLFISIHLNASGARYESRQVGTRQQTYYVYQGKGKKRKKIAKTRTVPVYQKFKLPGTAKGTQTYILANDWYDRKVKAVGGKEEIYEGHGEDSSGQDLFESDPALARILAQQYAKYFFQKSLTFATYCEEEFSQVGRYSWGVQQRDWSGIWVLQATQMPCVLVETGFIDNPEEERYLDSEEGQREIAHGIVNAIKRYREMLDNPNKGNGNTSRENAKPGPLVQKPAPVGEAPAALLQRKNEVVQTITTAENEITLNFYDNANVDGDTISVYSNQKLLLSRKGLNTRPLELKLRLDEKNPVQEIVMLAENEGLTPPNTALLLIKAGDKQYRVDMASDFKKSAAVKLVYKPAIAP